MKAPGLRTPLVVIAIVLAGLGAASLRVVLEGRAGLARGDALMTDAKPREAIAAWESAARWYLPFASHVDEAHARLAAVAAAPERPAELRLAAAHAERRAALATRHLVAPRDPAEANRRIAVLAAQDPEGALAGGPTRHAREAWHTERLARDPRPAAGPAALAVLGIVAWLVGIAVMVARGIDRAGRLVRRPALVAAALTLVGIAGWATGLYNA